MIDLLARSRAPERRRDFPGRADLQDALGLSTVRSNTRVWQAERERITAFAYIDDYANLRFELDRAGEAPEVEEIVAWAQRQLRGQAGRAGDRLETSCAEEDLSRIGELERCGFVRQPVQTLELVRDLTRAVEAPRLAAGFHLRLACGEAEIDDLVALHRAAFGTTHMTVEERRSMMQADGYEAALDLVACATGGQLAAACVCRIGGEVDGEGAVDTIATHPAYRRRGLARGLLLEGLQRLRERGACLVRLGTSSHNLPMRRTAASVGFVPATVTVWFALPDADAV